MQDLPENVFKIFTSEQWKDFRRLHTFAGSDDDGRDGFIHLCFHEQLEGTRRKHFAAQGQLVVARLLTSRLGAALRLEKSRGGALFPHLYRSLAFDDVVECWEIK